MSDRLELHELLCTILGSRNVYFQPPDNLQMVYPAIVYDISNRESEHADDIPYIHRKQYTLIIIDKNPDSLIPDKIGVLPTASFKRSYKANNLNHNVYALYY